MWSKNEADEAAKYGHFETAKWLLRFSPQETCSDLSMFAASTGDLPMLEWLDQQHYIVSAAAVDAASSNGHLTVVEGAVRRLGERLMSSSMDRAVGNDHLHVAKWLHAHAGQRSVDGSALVDAVRRGALETIDWALQTLTINDEDELDKAIATAAAQGNLAIVRLLYRHRG